jgi:hypothetical protein
VDTEGFQSALPRRHVPAEIFHRLQIRTLDVPSLGWALRRCEIGGARDRSARQLHAEDALPVLPRPFVEDSEAIVGEHALHHELALFELPPFDEIARRAFRRAPDDRHCLEILCADRGKELLDRGAGRRGAGERASGLRAARGEYHDERDDRTLHGMSPAYL